MIFERTERCLPLIAVSACLIGHNVRYDGENKAHQLLQEHLFPCVEVVPICPEVEAGLAVPRPPVQLVQEGKRIRALGRDDPALDVTSMLTDFAKNHVNTLKKIPVLCGYIFKSKSPSCGLGSTPVYDSAGHVMAYESGIYAAHVWKQLPALLLAEESRFTTPERCQQYVDQLNWINDIYSAATDAEVIVLHQHAEFLWKNLPIAEALDRFVTDRDVSVYLASVASVMSKAWQS